MGEYFVKIDRSQDLYVYWSEITDTPTMSGTRADFLDHYGQVVGECPTCHTRISQPASTEARLSRADLWGSSSFDGFYRWGQDEFSYANLGVLRRGDIPAVVELLADGAPVDDPRIRAFLTPFEDTTAEPGERP